jgi:hypothetical protein
MNPKNHRDQQQGQDNTLHNFLPVSQNDFSINKRRFRPIRNQKATNPRGEPCVRPITPGEYKIRPYEKYIFDCELKSKPNANVILHQSLKDQFSPPR